MWNHAVTMARSRSLTGPYELHPDVYIMSARHRPDAPLQRAGHADLVETQSGETYMVYLCGRPLRNRGRCVLGRETAIQKMVWGEDGWLRTTDGQGIPELDVPAPGPSANGIRRCCRCARISTATNCPSTSNGCAHRGPSSFSASVRDAAICGCSVARPSAACSGRRWSRVASRPCATARRRPWSSNPSIFSRPRDWSATTTRPSFTTCSCRRTTTLGKHIRVMSCLPDSPQADAFTAPIAIPSGKPVQLRVEVDFERLRFAYRGRREARGNGCRSSSTPAFSATKRRNPECRISPATSSAWRARTWQAPHTRRLRFLRVSRA